MGFIRSNASTIQKSGYIIKTAEELEKLRESSIFRMQMSESAQPETGESKLREIHFEDMQLKVGHKLQLRLLALSKGSGESNNNFYVATLMGYVQDSTLIVSMPTSGQFTREPFVEGDQIQIRLFSGQCVFSFTVLVDKIIKLPFKYLHLSFPKNIFEQTIRKSRRIKYDIQASAGSEATPLTITDLSTTGAKLSANTNVGAMGTMITLSFTIKILDKEIPLSLKSINRSVKQVSENNQETLCFGVEFTELNSEQIFALRNLIYQEIVEHPEYVV